MNKQAWTPEQRAKIKAGNEAQRAAFAAQTIPINDRWRIIRADEQNWEVQKDGKFHGYYGKLPDAFRSLPATMLGEEAKTSLQAIMAALAGIRETIEQAVNRADFARP